MTKKNEKIKLNFLSDNTNSISEVLIKFENINCSINLISFDDFQNDDNIHDDESVLIFYFSDGLTQFKQWQKAVELSCRAQNIFPNNYSIFVAPVVSPYYITKLSQINIQECYQGKIDQPELISSLRKFSNSRNIPKIDNYFRISTSILSISRAIGSTFELPKLLNLIINKASKEFSAQRCSILLKDEKNEDLELAAAKGLPKDLIKNKITPSKNSIVQWVISHNKPLILNDKVRDKRFRSLVAEPHVKSSMCSPLLAHGKVFGVMNIARTKLNSHPFTNSDLNSLMVIASAASAAIENVRLVEHLLKNERFATIGLTLTGLAHCVKNILTTLMGGIILFEKSIEKSDFSSAIKISSILKSSATKLNILVMNMLDYSKKRTPFFEKVKISRIKKDIEDNLGIIANRTMITINWEIDNDLDFISVDHDRMFRSLMNLGINAIEAMPNGGNIFIRIKKMDEEDYLNLSSAKNNILKGIVIEFQDTGVGIPQSVIDKVFDPFFSTKGSKGTGLGLLTVKQFAEDMGGKITVKSLEKQGTTFSLFLPKALLENYSLPK